MIISFYSHNELIEERFDKESYLGNYKEILDKNIDDIE
jgi:hypothetical protein